MKWQLLETKRIRLSTDQHLSCCWQPYMYSLRTFRVSSINSSSIYTTP